MGGERQTVGTETATGRGATYAFTATPLPPTTTNDGDAPTLLRCKYFSAGCHDLIEARHYSQHLKKSHDRHLSLLENVVREQAEVIEDQIHMIAAAQRHQQEHKPPHQQHHSPAHTSCLFLWVVSVVAQVREYLEFDRFESDLYPRLLRMIEAQPDDQTQQQPASSQKTAIIQLWQVLYGFTFAFLIFCYVILFIKTRTIMGLQIMPITIFSVLVGFHCNFTQYLTSFGNCLAAIFLLSVWAVLNVALLPVF